MDVACIIVEETSCESPKARSRTSPRLAAEVKCRCIFHSFCQIFVLLSDHTFLVGALALYDGKALIQTSEFDTLTATDNGGGKNDSMFLIS